MKTLKWYSDTIKDELEGRDDIRLDKIFITHSPIDQKYIDCAVDAVKKYQNFDNIYITDAGCTIAAHCGPSCLGILYMVK